MSHIRTPDASQSGHTSTRIDQPHDAALPRDVAATDWPALAGHDPSQASEQRDRQTSELLSYVEAHNQEVEAKQAELNARLAQLDNEWRVVRLQKSQTPGPELINEQVNVEERDAQETPRAAATASTRDADGVHEFDEVESLVADVNPGDEPSAPRWTDHASARPSLDDWWGGSTPSCGGKHRAHDVGLDAVTDRRSSLEARDLGAGSGVSTSSLYLRFDESERRLLAERKSELDRRKAVLQRMQDETQALHREALETRLVTEQLWAELTDKSSSEELQQLQRRLRTRLEMHYSTMLQTLAERQDELLALRARMQTKQQELRDQSQKLQEWVDSRHEELKSHAAQLDARELLLDRREHRLQEEFSKWEAQRRGYKQQLERLASKLNLAGLSESEMVG